MQEASNAEMIRRKFRALSGDLDERARRRWAAVEAQALGWGGIAVVSRATGIHRGTVRAGLKELADPDSLAPDRQRRSGGGRKTYAESQPGLRGALDTLIEPSTRGSPTNPLRWTCKSTRRLAKELRQQDFDVSATTVRRLLRVMGYSLQGNRKTREGRQHPDRDAQFRYINRRIMARKRRREPSISVDTKKKKEVLGNLGNPGKTYRPKRKPIKVNVHDFPDPELGKAVPYGVYDIAGNEAWVSVGISHDTAEFAVESIRRWWLRLGRNRYGKARRLLVTADSGGSNSSRNRLWKIELQKLADKTGLIIDREPRASIFLTTLSKLHE